MEPPPFLLSTSSHTMIASQVQLSPFERVRQKSQEIKTGTHVTESELSWMLEAVVRGSLEGVKECLEQSFCQNGECLILHVQGDVKDITGLVLKGLTAFQYALRVGDIAMCKLILNYFKNTHDAADQMNALEQDEWLKRRVGGTYFTLEPTLKAYKGLDTNWGHWPWAHSNEYWRKVIGKLQKTWPSWLRYEIAEANEDSAWSRKAVVGQPEVRVTEWPGINNWTSGLEGDQKLGETFAWIRVYSFMVSASLVRGMNFYQWWHHDYECLDMEQSKILAYRAHLRAQFSTPLNHPARPSLQA